MSETKESKPNADVADRLDGAVIFLKCLIGLHDADITHWGVVPGAAEMPCKHCGRKFWQSVRSQRRAALRAKRKEI